MAQYGDNELLNRATEEQQREAELAQIRRIIRTEYRRMQSGEADADIAQDIAAEEAQNSANGATNDTDATAKPISKWRRTLRGIATGEVLADEGAGRVYDRLFAIVILFLVSITMHFWAIKTESTLNRLTKEVDLLHERSIRKREQCYQQCSHSSIVEQLRSRGIELYDPLEPSRIIK